MYNCLWGESTGHQSKYSLAGYEQFAAASAIDYRVQVAVIVRALQESPATRSYRPRPARPSPPLNLPRHRAEGVAWTRAHRKSPLVHVPPSHYYPTRPKTPSAG